MKSMVSADQPIIQQIGAIHDQLDSLLVTLNTQIDHNTDVYTNHDFMSIYSFSKL